MNGTPKQITVSLGISKRFSIEDMEELYAGIRLACEEYDVDMRGRRHLRFLYSAYHQHHLHRRGWEGKVVYRNGARETDLICVSGDLGAAYMGLQLLEREKAVLKGGDKDLQPDFSGRSIFLERRLKPEARRDIIQKLAEEGIQPTSMMDISDGFIFGITAYLYPKQSGLPSLRRTYSYRLSDGCNGRRIQYEPDALVHWTEARIMRLLFTVPIADHEKVSEMEGVKPDWPYHQTGIRLRPNYPWRSRVWTQSTRMESFEKETTRMRKLSID